MDFAFLRFCRSQGIPVGLFYRDIYWKFPDIFNASTTMVKRSILIPLFLYDLKKYRSCVDMLYLPTERMYQFIQNGIVHKSLPPAGVLHENSYLVKKSRPAKSGLHIFYVGATSGLYDNRCLLQAVKETENVCLTLCTCKQQWEQQKAVYEPFLCERIQVLHKSAEQLKEYYEAADIFAYCLQENDYLHMAMPIKIFEAVSYGTPILATGAASLSSFIVNNKIGWITEPTVDCLKKQFRFLLDHPEEIREKTENTINAAYCNTWEDRARQVAEDLEKVKRQEIF